MRELPRGPAAAKPPSGRFCKWCSKALIGSVIYINSISSVTGLVIIVALSFFLIPGYGIIGAGIAASVSYFSTTVVKVCYFVKTEAVNALMGTSNNYFASRL